MIDAHRTRHALITALAVGALLLLAPTSAAAWQALFLPAGTSTVDAIPTTEASRAVFATIDRAQPLVITLGGPLRAAATADLYVPLREPERSRQIGLLPRLEPVGGNAIAVRDPEATREEDPATGLRFQRVSSLRLEPGSRRLQVTSDVPNRALIVLHSSDGVSEFALDDPTKTPRTVARLRAWYDTAADATPAPIAPPTRSRSMVLGAALGALIVAAMVLLAGWWILRGRSAARRPRDDAQ